MTLRQRAPLVHCLTNEVVQSLTANVLLALGAAPAMVVQAEEARQFAALADALLINIGTLYDARADSMLAAIEAANLAGTPWVLDPVAVGALRYRSDFAHRLLHLRPAVIRGNASEILALAGAPRADAASTVRMMRWRRCRRQRRWRAIAARWWRSPAPAIT